jgi:glutamate racemase
MPSSPSKTATSASPIGIFDSGIGGLTVVKEVMQQLPHEDIIYYGDTARVPYGIKSIKTVREYALQITDFLLEQNVKAVLIACNTVAAAANEQVRTRCGDTPVLDVVQAGASTALEQPSGSGNIGVIGTLATINSQTYNRAIGALAADRRIFSQACPMLVPLAEEGWIEDEISARCIARYLGGLRDASLDALILGCTHYPLFKNEISRFFSGTDTQIIDSARSIAVQTQEVLQQEQLLNSQISRPGRLNCFVSDTPQRFQELAERFMGNPLDSITVKSLSL